MHIDYLKLNRLYSYSPLILIVLLSLALRLSLMSHYLDDWDSVNFAMALKDFSLALGKPQPPGYPVYVALGRIVDLLFHDTTKTLTVISAVSGSLSLIPTYLIAKGFFGDRSAILASILLSLAPAHLLFSEVAMTDMVSLLFLTTTVYLVYRGLDSARYTYISSFAMGITMGIRWTDVLLAPLFLEALRGKKLRSFAISISLAAIGISLWLVPMVMYTGPDEFIYIQAWQWSSASGGSTLSMAGGLSFTGLISTAKSLFDLFIMGWSWAFLVLIMTALLALGLVLNNDGIVNLIRDRRVRVLGLWISAYLIFSMLFYMLYIPRYLLPMFPPMAIIFAKSWLTILDNAPGRRAKRSMYLILALIIIAMSAQSIGGAYAIHTTAPAPVEAAQFIKENYPPKSTLVLGMDSLRHFQFYLDGYYVMDRRCTSPEDIYRYLLVNKTIIDEQGTVGFDAQVHQFSRSRDIYPKHEAMGIYEFKPRAWPVMLMDEGWYAPETSMGSTMRWMKGDASIFVYSKKNCTATLNMSAFSFQRPRTLQILSKGRKWDLQISNEPKDIDHRIDLEKGVNEIRLHVLEGGSRPCDFPELKNSDSRVLSVAAVNLKVIEDL